MRQYPEEIMWRWQPLFYDWGKQRMSRLTVYTCNITFNSLNQTHQKTETELETCCESFTRLGISKDFPAQYTLRRTAKRNEKRRTGQSVEVGEGLLSTRLPFNTSRHRACKRTFDKGKLGTWPTSPLCCHFRHKHWPNPGEVSIMLFSRSFVWAKGYPCHHLFRMRCICIIFG